MPRRAPSSHTTALSAVVVVLLVAPAVAPLAAASPRPVPACSVCSDRLLGSSAQSHDLSVSVESSTAEVRVHENATATWTVRADLAGPGVDDLRADPDLATDLVEDVLYRDADAVVARVESETLVARYRTPGFATRSFGAYRLDGLRDEPGARIYTGLGADRLTLVGPGGTTAALSPPDASVDGRRVTLSEWSGEWIVFARPGPTAPLVGSLAVLDAVGAVLVSNVAGFIVIPGLVLLGGLLGVLRVVRATDPTPSTNPRALAAVGLGLLAVVHPLLVGVQPFVNDYAPPLLAGGVAAVCLGVAATARDRFSVELAAATTLCCFLVGALAVFGLPLLVGDPLHPTDGFGDAVRTALPALPVLCCFPLGVAGTERRRAGLGTVLAAFALVAATAFDLTTTGQFALLGVVLALFGAVAVVVVGLPLVALGRAVSPVS